LPAVLESFATEFQQWAELVLDVDHFDTMIVLDFLDRAQEFPRDERVAVEVILQQVGAAQAAQMVDCTDGRYLECLVAERLPAILPDVRAYLRAGDLVAMPYREYLRTPEWAERATETRSRFGYRCAVCNARVASTPITGPMRGVARSSPMTSRPSVVRAMRCSTSGATSQPSRWRRPELQSPAQGQGTAPRRRMRQPRWAKTRVDLKREGSPPSPAPVSPGGASPG
jgi:hypothetical protein